VGKITGKAGCHVCAARNLPTEDNEDPASIFFLSQEAFNGLQHRFFADGFTLISVKLNLFVSIFGSPQASLDIKHQQKVIEFMNSGLLYRNGQGEI
jgi:hypothetical protein